MAAITMPSVAALSSTARPSPAYANTLIVSQTSIARRRSTRSTSTPAGSRVSSAAPSPIVPTSPARTGEPVRASTSSGTASDEIAVPRSDSD
jgi:hypothetical protein